MALALAFLFAAVSPIPPFSHSSVLTMWGGDGHKLVCEVAWQHLTPDAKTLIRQLRANDSSPTFSESCTWADEVGSERPETYNYHFINIPRGQAGMSMTRDCGDAAKRCAPWAIKHYAQILADPKKSTVERSEALKFLGHFVGDLHQPLHAGRLEDRGGNGVFVSFFGDAGTPDRKLNLHSVWDSRILRRANMSWPASADALLKSITSLEVAAWTNSDVIGWANESYRIDEEFVYPAAANGQLADEYYNRALNVAIRRIQQAGIRLAHLLNEAARGRTSFTF